MRFALLCTVVWLLGAVLALEPARASELRWDGSGGCSDGGQLLFELERALGEPLAAAGNLVFEVHVEAAPGSASARLQVRGAEGDSSSERRLIAADCARLTEMLAVAISLAIDSAKHDGGALPMAPKAPLPEAAAAATPVSTDTDPTSAPSPAVTSRFRPSTSAFVVGDVGSLPRPALGVGLGIELGWPQFSVELMATTLFAQRVHWSPGSEAGAEVSLTTATARACLPTLPKRSSSLTVPLCLGAELGRLEGVGRGVSPSRSRGILWLAARAEAGLSWEVPDTWLGLATTLAAIVPLQRDEFVLDGMGAIHRPSSVVGRLGSTLSVRFE